MLSGDFLDYFELDDKQLVFYTSRCFRSWRVIGVCYSTVENLTYRLRRNLQRGSSDDLLHPSQVLDRINLYFWRRAGKHLTMFYGVIDTGNPDAEMGVGGHFPMPVLLQNGPAEYLTGPHACRVCTPRSGISEL